MSFTPGTFDLVAQIETSALDVVVDVLLEELRLAGKTRFTQTIGGSGTAIGGQIDVEIVDLSVPQIRNLDLTDRFKPGNTLASFRVDATLQVAVTVFGLTGNLTETLFIALKDLQFGVFTTPGGLPVGVALGFQQIDLDAGGLSTLRALNPALNVLADFIALGVRTALSPLGLVPIPIFQFADAFVRLGLSFTQDNPHLGTDQAGDALFVAADFQAANNGSDIAPVVDIIAPGSPHNVAAVVADRPINQLLAGMLASNQLTRSIPTPGANFSVNSVNVAFLQPGPRQARIRVDAAASARIKVKKGGFFGSLFGKKKKVTIRAFAELELDASIVDDPVTSLAIVDFLFAAKLRARATIQSVLVGTLTVLLAPFIVPFFLLLSQALNIAADLLLPMSFDFKVSGAQLEVRLKKLDALLSLASAGFTEATVAMKLDASGDGTFQLDHFTRARVQQAGIQLQLGFTPESLETRPQELYLGVELTR